MADRESRVPSNGSSKISMGTTRWRRRRSCVAAVQFRNGVLLLAVLTRKKTQQFSGSRFHGKKKYSTLPILDEGSHGFRFFFSTPKSGSLFDETHETTAYSGGLGTAGRSRHERPFHSGRLEVETDPSGVHRSRTFASGLSTSVFHFFQFSHDRLDGS